MFHISAQNIDFYHSEIFETLLYYMVADEIGFAETSLSGPENLIF